MPYAEPEDLIARKDAAILGDLVGYGERVDEADLEGDSKIMAALEDASGEIDAALLQGKRYTPAQLQGLTGHSASYLKRLCCEIAFWLLWDRKPIYDDEDSGREEARRRCKKALDQLRTGEHVFDIDDVKEAGLPRITGASRANLERLNLTVDRARGHYYPRRLTPDMR